MGISIPPQAKPPPALPCRIRSGKCPDRVASAFLARAYAWTLSGADTGMGKMVTARPVTTGFSTNPVPRRKARRLALPPASPSQS